MPFIDLVPISCCYLFIYLNLKPLTIATSRICTVNGVVFTNYDRMHDLFFYVFFLFFSFFSIICDLIVDHI